MAAVVVAAGCSADVTRFSLGGIGTTGAIPLPFASTNAPAPGYTNAPPPAYAKAPGPPSVFEETALPPAAPPPPRDYRVVGRDYGPPPAGRPPRTGPPPPPPALASRPPPRTPALEPPAVKAPHGATVEVQAGDTLYSIARRYGVPASALKEINGLPGTTIRPGQRLALPAGAKGHFPPGSSFPPPEGGTGAHVAAAPPAGEAPPASEESRYTMKRGDTLSRIALEHKVSVDEIMRVNGITDPTKVWAGKELVLPGGSVAAADPPPPPAAPPPRIVQVKPRIITGGTGESPAPPPQKTAKRGDIATDALPPPAVASGKFRWPVRGRVIVGFGPQPDGSKNEGINLAAPLGTEIHAAESGRVHYVGDGLKSYGNLILIRHANDWATAYGHVDRILVKTNEEVKRGQVIARVGKSGPVDRPQLKFELRKASLPVDPLPHLAN